MKTAAPENKSLKTLKGQLFGAVSMMLVAAIALGTSTYAWFINNRTVEVEQMQLQVSSSIAMTVAVGKNDGMEDGIPENWTCYKTVITNDDITGAAEDGADWANMFVHPLQPASTTDDLLAAALGDSTFFYSLGTIENNKLVKFSPMGVGSGQTLVGDGYVKRIPLQFLSSTDLDVYLGKNGLVDTSSLVSSAGNEEQAKAIRTALRVAIVARNSPSDVTVLQFDDGTEHIVGAADNTGYSGLDLTGLSHSELAGQYIGIAGVGSDNKVTNADQLTAQLPVIPGNKYLATVGTDGTVTAPTTEDDPQPLFQLKANKPLDVDVFIWLEGTDMDCVSTLSTYAFNLALPFAGADTPTP